MRASFSALTVLAPWLHAPMNVTSPERRREVDALADEKGKMGRASAMRATDETLMVAAVTAATAVTAVTTRPSWLRLEGRPVHRTSNSTSL